MIWLRKFLYRTVDLFTPTPDYRRALQIKRHEALRGLIDSYDSFNSSRANIQYYEEKIARIDKILKTGAIMPLASDPIYLEPPSPSTGSIGKNTNTVL